MGVEIPIFPLGAVLFPHMPMSLHVFEERYRRMMSDCEEGGTGFGVIAIAAGREVGDPATPFSVGTLAQLREVERLDDGRYNLLISGATRFRVTALSAARPYLTAEVEYLEEVSETDAVLQPLAQRVSGMYRDYLTAVQRLAGREVAEVELPDAPELLSYLVSATLRTDTWRKQRLLETDSIATRLRGALRLLEREQLFTEQALAWRDPRSAAGAFTPN